MENFKEIGYRNVIYPWYKERGAVMVRTFLRPAVCHGSSCGWEMEATRGLGAEVKVDGAIIDTLLAAPFFNWRISTCWRGTVARREITSSRSVAISAIDAFKELIAWFKASIVAVLAHCWRAMRFHSLQLSNNLSRCQVACWVSHHGCSWCCNSQSW